MSVTLGQLSVGDPARAETGAQLPVVVAVIEPVPPRGWSVWKTIFLLSLPALIVVYVWLAARGIYGGVEYRRSPVTELAAEPNGAALYAQHCARCHGERGGGNGLTSPFLDPPARRFGEEKFQLASTSNGVPTDDDLLYVLRHGIPGTAMPAFDQLLEEERRALIDHVRVLTHSGLFAKLFRRAEMDGDPDVIEVSEQTAKQLRPGTLVTVPTDLPAATPESIARGAQLFAKNCATCHGPKGHGDGPQVKDMKNDNGRPTKPRDLARGVFEGGGEPDRVYLRIALGMPGTPMPASISTLKPQDIGDLVNFVLSLTEPVNAATGP